MFSFFSCEKEALVEDLPEINNSITDRDDGVDCNCEMQIISVNNGPDGVYWQIDDVTNAASQGETNELFYGYGEYVISKPLDSNTDPFYQVLESMPSSFVPINGGSPIFNLQIFMDSPPPKFSISTRIVCTSTDSNGNTTEMEYFFDFIPANGIPGPPGSGFSFFVFPLPFSILDC